MKVISTDEEFKQIDFKLLKRLIIYLKPYKWQTYLAIFLTILASALFPLRPYLIKIAIDDYISIADWNGLLNIILLIFSVLIINGALQFAQTYLMQWVGQNVLLSIRQNLFTHIQNLSLKFFDKNPVGRLVTRVTNDVEVLNELFSSGVVMIIADLLLICWIIAYMFFINVELSLLTLTILPVLIIATYAFKTKVRVVFRDIRKTVAQLNSTFNEFITGISTVKQFTQEEEQFKKFDETNVIHRNLWVKSVFYYAVFFPIIEMLSTIVLGIIIWYAAENILSGFMTIGILIAFLQYAEMFFRPIRDLTEKFTTLQSAMASSERIFGLLDTEEKIFEAENAKEFKTFINKIEFKNINFSYVQEKKVLENISFDVKKGEKLAIVGATGSGKTTIINLLSRFYDYENGQIRIDGINLKDFRISSLREKIAIIQQDVFLFSRTIYENIFLKDVPKDIESAKEEINKYGIGCILDSLSDIFQTKLAERGATLSAGQRQLISICRALVANPEILILDEATSNIDSKTEQIIETLLNDLLAGRTAIIIAHRLSTIKNADRILVLHHGKVNDIGTHEELLQKDGLYAKLYRLQMFKEKK
ncbi:MAG TPA: ABC transporter ATP-binding protein [Candidatus Kapabacteria bacterium]|nr:ABC transporter ATP-binding protein [Candidatus Kapabacteria bacterium]HPO62133.1 ABC transporter ATP-binding protein [Candidatus Kapabacteria bacterium]